MNIIINLFLVITFFGCASITKEKFQAVRVVNGPTDSIIKIETPESTQTIQGGSGVLVLFRSRSNVPYKVTCKDKVRDEVLVSEFGWGRGFWGNFVWMYGAPIGWFVDALTDKGYDFIEPINLKLVCQ